MPEITIENIETLPRQRRAHLDGGDRSGRFFIEFQVLADNPRIGRTEKHWHRRGKPVEVTWSLDGEPVGSAESVVAALAANPFPPTTPVEKAALLSVVGDDWTKQEGMMPIKLQSLTEKGLIEWREQNGTRDHCRRTELGKRLLAQHFKTDEEVANG